MYNEIINTQKKIMDYNDEKFNPNKKKFKKLKKKIIEFDSTKKPCKFIITTTKTK